MKTNLLKKINEIKDTHYFNNMGYQYQIIRDGASRTIVSPSRNFTEQMVEEFEKEVNKCFRSVEFYIIGVLYHEENVIGPHDVIWKERIAKYTIG